MNKSTAQLAFAKLSTIRMYLYQWALKWHYGNTREDTSQKPDLPVIICILQAMGFKLREFEKKDEPTNVDDNLMINHYNNNNNDGETAKSETIRITMECGTSKMTAVLDMDDVKCTCQDNAEVNAGSLWSVTGTGPTDNNHLQRIEETGSNLLPDVPKEAMQAIQDVIFRIVKIINAKGDVNLSEFKEGSGNGYGDGGVGANNALSSAFAVGQGSPKLVRSQTDIYRQPNIERRINESNLSKFASNKSVFATESEKEEKEKKRMKPSTLQRQGTYEIDDLASEVGLGEMSQDEPRSPPPRISNSPVEPLCMSLGQISMQSDEEMTGLADYVFKAHKILDGAVKYIKNKIIPSNSSFDHDESGNAKPTIQQLMSSSLLTTSPRSSIGSYAGSTSSRAASVSSKQGSECSGSAPSMSVQLRQQRMQLQQQRPIPKPGGRTSVGGSNASSAITGLPRDRSSSLSSVQRPVISKISKIASTGSRSRNNSTSLNTSGLVQRSTSSAGLKPPASSSSGSGVKLAQSKSTISSLTSAQLARHRPSPNTSISSISQLAKRRTSPNSSITSVANKSLIKQPSSSRFNSSLSSNVSKFGWKK